jgi:hypothetical protein
VKLEVKAKDEHERTWKNGLEIGFGLERMIFKYVLGLEGGSLTKVLGLKERS